MAASKYTLTNSRIKALAPFLSNNLVVAVMFVNEGRFLQLIFESNWRKAQTHSVTTITQTIMEVIVFFQFFLILEDGLQKNTLMVI